MVGLGPRKKHALLAGSTLRANRGAKEGGTGKEDEPAGPSFTLRWIWQRVRVGATPAGTTRSGPLAY